MWSMRATEGGRWPSVKESRGRNRAGGVEGQAHPGAAVIERALRMRLRLGINSGRRMLRSFLDNNSLLSFRDGPKGRTRNPYLQRCGLGIPGSLAFARAPE